jgi:hypothetical protein
MPGFPIGTRSEYVLAQSAAECRVLSFYRGVGRAVAAQAKDREWVRSRNRMAAS